MRRSLVLVVLLAAACTNPSHPPPRQLAERIVHRVVLDGVTTTVVTDVLRPYRARVLTYAGDQAEGTATGFAWDERGLYTVTDGSATQTEYVAPGFPGPASRLDLSLPVAERQGLVTRLGTSSVLDRDCTRWRSELPLDGAPLSPAHAAADSTESCVDPAGRLLADTWRVGGRVVRTRTAVSVGPGADLSGTAWYGAQPPAPLPTAASSFVVKDSTPAELTSLLQVAAPAAPVGLRPDRSVAVLDVNAERKGFSREAAVLTWRGTHSLAVLRIERDLEPAGRTARGKPVDLGALGRGRLEPLLAGLRITVEGPRGLRIIATSDLPEPALLAWVRSLRF